MKTFFLVITVLLFSFSSVLAEDTYDGNDEYQGQIDNNGNMYDANDEYQGQIDNNGNMYDANGEYQGSIIR